MAAPGRSEDLANLPRSRGSRLGADVVLLAALGTEGGPARGRGQLRSGSIAPRRPHPPTGTLRQQDTEAHDLGQATDSVWPQFSLASSMDNIIAFLPCSCPDWRDLPTRPCPHPVWAPSGRVSVLASIPHCLGHTQPQGNRWKVPGQALSIPHRVAVPRTRHLLQPALPGDSLKVAHLQSYSSRLHHLKGKEKGTPSTSAGTASNFSKSQISHSRKITSVPAVGHCYSAQSIISWR